MMSIQELRSYRIFGIAIFDLVLGMLGLCLVFLYIHYRYYSNLDKRPFIIAGILLTIPVGIVSHMLFGVNTTLNYRLGLSYNPSG